MSCRGKPGVVVVVVIARIVLLLQVVEEGVIVGMLLTIKRPTP